MDKDKPLYFQVTVDLDAELLRLSRRKPVEALDPFHDTSTDETGTLWLRDSFDKSWRTSDEYEQCIT